MDPEILLASYSLPDKVGSCMGDAQREPGLPGGVNKAGALGVMNSVRCLLIPCRVSLF